MHQGDFDDDNDPAAREAQIDDVLDGDFPHFVSVGNHDVDAWGGSGGYQPGWSAGSSGSQTWS